MSVVVQTAEPVRSAEIQTITLVTPPQRVVHCYTALQLADIEDEISCYIEKINEDIGFYWWKRYIYSAFWSNVSTPINLSILIFTALTTGQNATQNLIGQRISTILGVVVLFVTIFNTFFQPNEQLAHNRKIMLEWTDVGNKFDEIYYDRVYTPEEKADRLQKLEKLFKSLSSLKRTNDANFLIDFLFMIIRCICIRDNIRWISNKNNIIALKQRRHTLSHINTNEYQELQQHNNNNNNVNVRITSTSL